MQRSQTEDTEEQRRTGDAKESDRGRRGVKTRDAEEPDGGRKGAGRGRQRSQKDDTIDSYGGAGQRIRSSISRFVFICSG